MLAYDKATGTTGTYTVTATWQHLDPFITTLTIAGEEIETTPEHPFFVMLRGWVAAGDLRVGDSVRLRDGSYALVDATETVYDPQVMYTMTVAEAHTYFVGDDGCTVHNARKCPLDDVADFRNELGLPSRANDPQGKWVVSRLDIGGQSFYGNNAKGAGVRHPQLPNSTNRSIGHAEYDSFGQASQAFPGGVGGGVAKLYVDRNPCPFCKSNFGTWARHLGLDALIVISENGYCGMWLTPPTGGYRTR